MTSSRRFAEVIGKPVDRSRSPDIHRFWLDRLGIDGRYERTTVERQDLRAFVERRRGDPDWLGCNVTMPLKLEAMTVADESSDRALGAGAANILLPRDGRIYAGNTDVAAVQNALVRLAESGAPMRHVTLLGSGGAARAVLLAMRILGHSAVCIQARDMTEAYALAVQFRLSCEPKPFHSAIAGDGLINATPLGSAGAPPMPLSIAGLSSQGWVMDYSSVPSRTALLDEAAKAGLKTVSGLDLLIDQAAESFQLFFGAAPPRDEDETLIERLAQ